MNKGVLIDSDVLIWFLRGKFEIINEFDNLMKNSKLFTTPINVAEIFAGAKKKEINSIENFFNFFEIINVNVDIGRLAGEYINKYSRSCSIELADSLVAASALYFEIPLWTLNKKHYPMIKKNNFYK